MNVPSNVGKSTLLAMCIFWIINFTKDVSMDLAGIVLLSAIPIFICVTLVIIITICPIFWILKKDTISNYAIAKKYFPYYAIVMFGLCLMGVIASRADIYSISFFITVFITTAQSWVWFAKENKV
ncbi:hypothetical protein [uncultured Lacinutrix sp.]|uniref:hypothetical protein n=1 Tax=uncultured Lacinutrix sp. TaxID=574032 RepID=UPI002625B645|nr:hypothetical protein [uncultured Lacinutrix sp.]